MSKKISELTALTTSDDADILAIVDTSASETKKQTKANFLKEVVARILALEESASSGSTRLTATGMVNGSNSVYLFDEVPSGIYADGLYYERLDYNGNPQWTYTGTTTITVTLIDIQPAFSIFGVSGSVPVTLGTLTLSIP